MDITRLAMYRKMAGVGGSGGSGGGDNGIKWLFKDAVFNGVRTDLPPFDTTTHDAYVFINDGACAYKLESDAFGVGYMSDSASNDSPFISFLLAAIEGFAPANAWIGGNTYGGAEITASVFLVEKQ